MKPLAAIYVDLDQVLADWTGGLLKLLDLDAATVHAHWSADDWDVVNAIASIPPAHWNGPHCSTGSAVWDRIDAAGEAFWSELELFPWAHDLWALCQAHADRVLIVSSPSHHPSAHAGKARWLHRHFGDRFNSYFLGWDKAALARPGHVLIDDRPKNCDGFRAEGGHAVLFPARGNANYIFSENPLAFTADALRRLGSPKCRACAGRKKEIRLDKTSAESTMSFTPRVVSCSRCHGAGTEPEYW